MPKVRLNFSRDADDKNRDDKSKESDSLFGKLFSNEDIEKLIKKDKSKSGKGLVALLVIGGIAAATYGIMKHSRGRD